MDITYEAYLARIFPPLVSLILSMLRFNFSVMKVGVQADEKDSVCGDFDRQKEKKFPCLKRNATALSMLYAAISIAMSFFVTAILHKELMSAALLSGGAMLIVMIAAVVSDDFYLIGVRHPKLAPHAGWIANLAALAISAATSYAVLH